MSTYFDLTPPELNNIILSYLPFDDLFQIKDLVSEWKSILIYSYPIKGITSNDWFQLYYTYKFLEQEFEYIIGNILDTSLEPEILINKIKLEFPVIKIFPQDNQVILLYSDLMKLKHNKLIKPNRFDRMRLRDVMSGKSLIPSQYFKTIHSIIKKVNTITQINLINMIKLIPEEDLLEKGYYRGRDYYVTYFENYIK